jgi:predicted unusual protein kinase regulating ubiquinone biosynthesis (AarF/ABC1/UbiB family)
LKVDATATLAQLRDIVANTALPAAAREEAASRVEALSKALSNKLDGVAVEGLLDDHGTWASQARADKKRLSPTEASQATSRTSFTPRTRLVAPAWLQPTVEAGIHRRFLQEVVVDRLTPLVKKLVAAQVEVRTESGKRALAGLEELNATISSLDATSFADVRACAAIVEDVSAKATIVAADLDHASLGLSSAMLELRTIALILRTAKVMRNCLRIAAAPDLPEYLASAHNLWTDTCEISSKASAGENVAARLHALEAAVIALDRRVSEQIGEPATSGALQTTIHRLALAEEFRGVLAGAVNEAQGRPEGSPVRNADIAAHLKTHGFPVKATQDFLCMLVMRELMGEDAESLTLTKPQEDLLADIRSLKAHDFKDMPSLTGSLYRICKDATAAADDLGKVMKPEPAVKFAHRLRDTLENAAAALNIAYVTTSVIAAGARLAENSPPEILRAIAAFTNLEMPEAERARIYESASGEALTQSVLDFLRAFESVPRQWTFAGVGKAINGYLHDPAANDALGLKAGLRTSSFAFAGEADFASATAGVDGLFTRLDNEETRQNIDSNLKILRAIGSAESSHLVKIAMRLPPKKQDQVLWAVGRYVAEMLAAVASGFAAATDSASVGKAIVKTGDKTVDLGNVLLDELGARDPKRLTAHDIRALIRNFETGASGAAKVGLKDVAKDTWQQIATQGVAAGPADAMRAAGARLKEAFAAVEMTAEGKDALNKVVEDLGAAARTAVGLITFFGAASNTNMAPDERKVAIKEAVEGMGPVFIKMMQTVANMQSLLGTLTGTEDSSNDDPIQSALRELQDNVTPAPWDAIRREIESSLNMPLGEAFLSIDPHPLASGSIGQLHRAKIQTNDGPRNVVIKVLRPQVKALFADTMRVVGMTLSVTKELLALDRRGDIFGTLRKEAEIYLPMLERALHAFVLSFEIETDFSHEVQNMRRFDSLLAADRHVRVPKVFDSHTRGNVIAMEEVSGFKLSTWISRFQFSRGISGVPEQAGPVPDNKTALRRAKLWVFTAMNEEATGAEVVSHSRRKGYQIAVTTPQGTRLVDISTGGVFSASGAVPPLDEEATLNRIGVWARKAYGMQVQSVAFASRPADVSQNGSKGRVVEVEFIDSRQPSARVFVDSQTLELRPLTEAPDLSEAAIADLRDHLVSTFANQAVRGFLHGDMHAGNFFIMPDGKTIAILDMGLMIDMEVADITGPLRLLAGAILDLPHNMARAVVGVSSASEALDADQVRAIQTRLASSFETLLQEARAKPPRADQSSATKPESEKTQALSWLQRLTRLLCRSAQVSVGEGGLVPSGHYMQLLKTTFAMVGNMAAFEAVRPSRVKMIARLATDIFLYQVLASYWQATGQTESGKEL